MDIMGTPWWSFALIGLGIGVIVGFSVTLAISIKLSEELARREEMANKK